MIILWHFNSLFYVASLIKLTDDHDLFAYLQKFLLNNRMERKVVMSKKLQNIFFFYIY